MPTYEYICKNCGCGWEEIQKISEPPVEVCPTCGAPQAQRLISQGNFILKGSGWYATGGYGESKASTTKTSDAPQADSTAKSETAPKAESTSTTSTSTESSSTNFVYNRSITSI